MTTLLSMLTASMVAFAFTKVPLPFGDPSIHAVFDLIVWGMVFIVMKRYMTNLRP